MVMAIASVPVVAEFINLNGQMLSVYKLLLPVFSVEVFGGINRGLLLFQFAVPVGNVVLKWHSFLFDFVCFYYVVVSVVFHKRLV